MTHISASDLKTKGIAAIEFALSTAPEAIVSVRGKDRFVVMEMARYHYLRECELDAAPVWPLAVRYKSRPMIPCEFAPYLVATHAIDTRAGACFVTCLLKKTASQNNF